MDAASMEQMNKLRKSLGLPLLNVPGGAQISTTPQGATGPSFKPASSDDEDGNGDGELASTLETREAAGFDNFKKIQDDEKRRLEREERKKKIQRERDRAARSVRLEGKGLGDVDDSGDVDAKAWLKGRNKRQKEIEKERARKLEEEIAERERLAAVEYTSKDLAGVQVAHEIGDFEDGLGEQVLTLKDQEIGNGDEDDDEMGDVLENADIVSRDKTKDKLDLKKKIAYDVHDTDQKGLLSQYDDKKRKAFTLDASGGGITNEERDTKRQAIGDRLKGTVSLDFLKPEPVSDYQEIRIKKVKKTKKNKRVKEIEEEDIFPTPTAQTTTDGDQMDIDKTAAVQTQPISKADEFSINDDEDLATALSFTRRAALKKKKRRTEDLMRQLKEEDDEEKQEPEQGMTLDDTTVFLTTLSARPTSEERVPAQKPLKSVEREPPRQEAHSEDEEDTEMGEAVAVAVDTEDGVIDEVLDRMKREQEEASALSVSHSGTGLGEEQSLSTGIGAALSLLRQRGLVKAGEEDKKNKNDLHRARQTFHLESQLREHDHEQRARAQREQDRNSGKLNNMSVREREEHARWQNTHRDHQASKEAAIRFNQQYKPDVTLKYVDDDGRLMNQKEAFKHLSHKFHGKGSGKTKTEKHLKKIDEEKRREARSVLDNSKEMGRGYEGAAQHQRKGGEAGVRLQ